MRRIALIAGFAVLATSTAAPAGAQDVSFKVPVEHDQMLSASPILWMYKVFNLDYERKIAPAVTLGASGSYLPFDGFDYGRATFHARFYPQRDALSGFYVGAQGGVHWAGADRYEARGAARERDHSGVLGAGMDIGYAWRFGPNRDVGLTLGLGTTRLFGGALDGQSVAIPNVRLFNVGLAF
jgi:hypothetical protein